MLEMTSSQEVHKIAQEVAKATVHEMLLGLGVDFSDPDATIKMQADFAHLRAWRESSELVKRKGLTAAVTVIVSGLLGLIWLAFRGHS